MNAKTNGTDNPRHTQLEDSQAQGMNCREIARCAELNDAR